MTNADDRATLETLGRVLTVLWEHDADKIPNLLDRRAVTYRDPAGCLAALRSALQVPDAAEHDCEDVGFERGWWRGLHQGQDEAKAQARRDAIEECAKTAHRLYFEHLGARDPGPFDSAPRNAIRAEAFNEGARFASEQIEGRIRALAAQPAARSEKEHEQRVSSRESAAAPEKAAQDGDSGEAPMQTTSINPGSTPGAPTSPTPDDAAVQAKRVFAAWSRAFERHDTRPAAEVVLEIVRSEIARLRQPPAPESVELDVFEAFAREWFGYRSAREGGALADLLREWFGPLVSAFEMIANHPCGAEGLRGQGAHCGECAWCIAKEELAQLRARAKEASRG